MQHLHSSTGDEDVENEAATQDLLQRRAKKLDVGVVSAGALVVIAGSLIYIGYQLNRLRQAGG